MIKNFECNTCRHADCRDCLEVGQAGCPSGRAPRPRPPGPGQTADPHPSGLHRKDYFTKSRFSKGKLQLFRSSLQMCMIIGSETLLWHGLFVGPLAGLSFFILLANITLTALKSVKNIPTKLQNYIVKKLKETFLKGVYKWTSE